MKLELIEVLKYL